MMVAVEGSLQQLVMIDPLGRTVEGHIMAGAGSPESLKTKEAGEDEDGAAPAPPSTLFRVDSSATGRYRLLGGIDHPETVTVTVTRQCPLGPAVYQNWRGAVSGRCVWNVVVGATAAGGGCRVEITREVAVRARKKEKQ